MELGGMCIDRYLIIIFIIITLCKYSFLKLVLYCNSVHETYTYIYVKFFTPN